MSYRDKTTGRSNSLTIERPSFPSSLSRRSVTPTRMTPVAETQLSTKNRGGICDVKVKQAMRKHCKFCGIVI